MPASEWIEFLRSLPPPLQHNLVLNTTTGSEIAIHSIIRMGSDYLIIRGRLTGTTEAVGFFLLPLERVNYVGFSKIFKENEFRSLIGEPTASDEAKQAAPPDADQSEAQAAAKAESATAPPAKPSISKQPSNTHPGHANRAGVDKAALLERLRAKRPSGV